MCIRACGIAPPFISSIIFAAISLSLSARRFQVQSQNIRKKQADRLHLREGKYCFISSFSFYLLARLRPPYIFLGSRRKNKRLFHVRT